VVDMVAPLGLEVAEVGGGGLTQNALARWRVREQGLHLALADLVLCANERQRDLALGVALATGAMHRRALRGPLANRIAVVPHGMEAEPPGTGRLPLREAGAVGPSDRIVLWAGGMWSWFDPLTAVKAIERLRARRADVKLAIVAFEHPDPVQRAAHAGPGAEVERYVRERGLEDGVVLRPEWLGREAYFDHLREADVGLSLHHATLEARFAARTRIVDYLQAGLRIVCTAGDTMADLVASNGFGEVVAAGDPAGCAAAVDRLTSGRRERLDTRAALAALEWSNVARPLVDFCAGARGGGPPPAAPALVLTARQYPAFAAAVYRAGPRDLVAAAARRGRAAARRVGGIARR
jgi:glycosyltransferase involved in cell wall biosynthesis